MSIGCAKDAPMVHLLHFHCTLYIFRKGSKVLLYIFPWSPYLVHGFPRGLHLNLVNVWMTRPLHLSQRRDQIIDWHYKNTMTSWSCVLSRRIGTHTSWRKARWPSWWSSIAHLLLMASSDFVPTASRRRVPTTATKSSVPVSAFVRWRQTTTALGLLSNCMPWRLTIRNVSESGDSKSVSFMSSSRLSGCC